MTPTDRMQRLREGCARLVRASEQLSTPRILGIVGPVALAAVSAGLFLILSEAGSTPARSQGTAQLRPTQAFSKTATPSATQVSKLDCAAQQWPYVDERCAKRNGEIVSTNGMRKVRIIGRDGKSWTIMSARPDIAPTETAQAARTTMATKSDSAPLTPLDYKSAKTETAQTDAPAAAQTASNETTGSAPAVDSAVDVSATHSVVDQAAAKAEKKAKAKRARAAKIAARAAREHQAARKRSNPGDTIAKRSNPGDTIAMVRSLPDQSDSRHVTVRYGYSNDDRDGFSRFYVVPASSSETW